MQPQDLESVTTVEPNEQIDARERQPYQAPRLVRLDLAATEIAAPSLVDSGSFS
ncbi:hypothetical protein [Pseudomonas sp. C11]|uniref:hypothetical protein n=1 Tax=Pseudomonas sp. C11 TaxID=3075550 RepID=UPI002AFE8FC4|nr:hypothetical protein [Pseudomonas sp. C11]